jgi:cell wall-associated NlpC family hydrolase
MSLGECARRNAVGLVFATLALLAALVAAGPAVASTSRRYIDVSVATVWTSPTAPRTIDRPALGNPADVAVWTHGLTTAARRGLVGRIGTQALFGEPVEVLARRGSWTRIAVVDQPTPRDPRGYPGWVPTRQLSANESFGALLSGPVAVVSATAVVPGGELGALALSFGTSLPVVGLTVGNVLVATPDGRTVSVASSGVHVYPSGAAIPRPSGPELVATARLFLGLRYLWGGTSAFGFDCSGLVNLIYRVHGIVIPRDADAQALAGRYAARRSLRPGDLIFFATDPPSRAVTHVAMYVGSGRMIESPDSAGSVRMMSLASRGREYVTARRYLPAS